MQKNVVSCAILNTGQGAWAFEEHEEHLVQIMQLKVRSSPAQYNYLLGWESTEPPSGKMFIPYQSILLASDKRRMAEVFQKHGVAIPRTYLLDSLEDVQRVVDLEADSRWILKWPTGCGASGHRLIGANEPIPEKWSRPYLLQEFIDLENPEVYRLYGIAGETFGWNVRRFPMGAKYSPWVAHAQGAFYESVGTAPAEAEYQARQALAATGLLDSFGCTDLLYSRDGRWLVLEVNTDGIFNYVDRDISVPGIAEAIDRRLVQAFWAWVEFSATDGSV
ncbi:MAG: ATP-grasp domain-containing protein [Cyanobacteriota bacterium]